MFTPSRNPEWSNAARGFMLRTAASIVTASKYAPITRPTTSSANGATAGVHRAIIFLSGQYSSGKCVWARIFRTLARAYRLNRKTLHPPEPQVLQPRPRRRAAHQRQAPLRLAQIQVLQQTQVRRLPKQPRRPRQRVLLRQPPDRQRHLPLRQRQVHQQLRVRRHRPLRHLPQPWQRQVRPHHQARQRVLLEHREELLQVRLRQRRQLARLQRRLSLRRLRRRSQMRVLEG